MFLNRVTFHRSREGENLENVDACFRFLRELLYFVRIGEK